MSLTQYLKALRMREAKDLLETTFLSVKEIRRRVGVQDKDQFARDFKRFYGVTPTRYRSSQHISKTIEEIEALRFSEERAKPDNE